MITKRIIPCLDVKDGRVVKGVNFLGLADVSSPVKLAEFYSQNGADELVFYDITASSDGRRLFTDILCAKLLGIRSAMVEPYGTDEGFLIGFRRSLEKMIVKRKK